MIVSPTSRTLNLLRKRGWTCGIVERYISFIRIRVDLYGFIDIVGIHPKRGILGVQTTTTSNQSARITKILKEPRAKIWLKSGGKIRVMGWSKKGARGKRKTWQVSERNIVLADFTPMRV